MLVLTRKVGEGIAIGDDVKIVVMQIKGKQVRLGIKASASTIVHREEIYQRIQEENRSASTSESSQLDEARNLFSANTPAGTPPAEPGLKRAPLRRHVRPPRPRDD